MRRGQYCRSTSVCFPSGLQGCCKKKALRHYPPDAVRIRRLRVCAQAYTYTHDPVIGVPLAPLTVPLGIPLSPLTWVFPSQLLSEYTKEYIERNVAHGHRNSAVPGVPYVESLGAFDGLSSYRADYVRFKTAQGRLASAPPMRAVHGDRRFDDGTTYKQDFIKMV